jgi:hypothetical protein
MLALKLWPVMGGQHFSAMGRPAKVRPSGPQALPLLAVISTPGEGGRVRHHHNQLVRPDETASGILIEGRDWSLASEPTRKGRDRDEFPVLYAWADANATLFGYMEDS